MAYQLIHASFPLPRITKKQPSSGLVHQPNKILSMAAASSPDNVSESTIAVRRSANYSPPSWDFNYIQSLNSQYVGDLYTNEVNEMKKEVMKMLENVVDVSSQLDLIDVLQRLGISYHFEHQINSILTSIHNSNHSTNQLDLHFTSLQFRLLRQHGFSISQDVFSRFVDDSGKFKSCLSEDTKGILSLYEASYLLFNGEQILDEAMEFTTKHLQDYIAVADRRNGGRNDLCSLIDHALEMPLHWRMERLESRWFIDFYERKLDMNPLLLRFAKVDYNLVQATFQEELRDVSRWCENTRLGIKFRFGRDRVLINYLAATGMTFEPEFSYCRKVSTKLFHLITFIDDIYDVYGTLDELKLFTDAVDRWDINAMDSLPEYMKIAYLALFNSTNEMAYDALIDQGAHVISYLKKSWAVLCKTQLQEAKWYYSGYTPSIEEYIQNALVSVSTPAILIHAYVYTSKSITTEALDCLLNIPDIIRYPSIITRLNDDLGTCSYELKRGDVPKSVQCYMNQAGVSEEKAREHVKYLIREEWKKMNETNNGKSDFSNSFIKTTMNFGRMAHCIYQHGDGFAVEDSISVDRVLKLLVNPISISF